MKTIRVTSIVLAAAGSWYDWRVGAAAMLLLALACEWLLHRVSELEVLVELSEMRAIRDPLTCLFNRRWLEETGFEVGASTGAIVADVDHFKSYNDRWGHAGGDAALQQIARLMRRLFGNGEIVCRLGGEEFGVIMGGANQTSAMALASRLTHRLTDFDFGPAGRITVSVGLA
jgi:two-component system cell cycle response regulator